MELKLSIIICTFNRASSLKECLESLTQQSFSDFEIVIIDGGSTDKSNKVIAQFSDKLRIKKILDPTKELARARDRGWQEAQGELVSWIDDDVAVSKDWVKSVVEIMNENKDVAGVSGPTLIKKELLGKRDIFFFYKKKGVLGFLGEIWNRFFLEGRKYEVGRIFKSGAWSPGSNFPASLEIKGLKEVDYLEACNMTLRRSLVVQVNGFDYGYTGVGEWSELDLAMRIKEIGHRLVFSSKVRVNHNISRGGVYQRRTRSKKRMENFFKFYFRHIFKPRLDYIFKFSAYIVFLNLYWLYKAITSKNLDWLGGWVGTITGLRFLKSSKRTNIDQT